MFGVHGTHTHPVPPWGTESCLICRLFIQPAQGHLLLWDWFSEVSDNDISQPLLPVPFRWRCFKCKRCTSRDAVIDHVQGGTLCATGILAQIAKSHRDISRNCAFPFKKEAREKKSGSGKIYTEEESALSTLLDRCHAGKIGTILQWSPIPIFAGERRGLLGKNESWRLCHFRVPRSHFPFPSVMKCTVARKDSSWR